MGRPPKRTNWKSGRQERHRSHGITDIRHRHGHSDSPRPFLVGQSRSRGRRRPYFDRNTGQRRYHQYGHPLTSFRSAIAGSNRRTSADLGKDLDELKKKEPFEIILTLGGNIESFKRYLRISDTCERIDMKLLTVLEKGFNSESTPAILLNVINTIVEMEFILHAIKKLKTHFYDTVDDVDDKDNERNLDAVSAVLRILIRMYSLNPSAVTFILGSFEYMSDLMETIRNSLKVNEPDSSYKIEQTEMTESSEMEDVNKLDIYSDRVQNNSEIIKMQNTKSEQNSGKEEYKDVDRLSFNGKTDTCTSVVHLRVRFEETSLPCDSISSRLSSVENLFARLDEHRRECIAKRTKRKENKTTYCTENPKEDFREIPIFPRLGDLSGDIQPNLRVNNAKGGYKGVDDYLDVQFRLLREDFVEPLRDGIFAFTGQIFGKNKKKIQEIKVYENVHIESFICGDGLNHVLRFDNSKLKHIRWNMSKRLKYGSLVCLSSDNFKTCFFATVVNNDVKFRRQGRVHVKFAHDSKLIKLLIGSTFTMIESTAYFEAYRPVLASLQTITENDLPFQEYIIKCNDDILPPKYLRRSKETVNFDLRSLLEPDVEIRSNLRKFKIEEIAVGRRKKTFSYESQVMKSVNILESKWPREDMIQLDLSQLNAVKTALTSEFSIIQGPPGCGKTHIGLEIAKVLLHNKHVWRHEDGSRAQLLVVCYTNHALDQFMEGVCSFFKGDILRVGGRSSNDNMEQYNLKAIKNQFRKEKAFPRFIYRGRVSAQQNVRSLRSDLNLESEKIRSLRENIVHEKSLYKEMGSLYNQFVWLKHKRRTKPLPPWLAYLEGSGIIEWLGIIDIAQKIQDDVYYTSKIRQDRDIEKLLDQQIIYERRETMVDIELDLQKQLEDEHQMDLKKFRKDHISLDFDEMNNVDGHLFTESKRLIVKRERRTLTEKVQRLLRETKPMSESEALSVGDILGTRFTKEKRWALYLFWVQKKCNKMYLDLEKKIDEFQAADERSKEIIMIEERHIFRAADIIGMTVTGAAKHKTVLREIKPTIMIVEEAAELLESHLISNLTSGCEQLILIGDHKQLKPKPNVYRLEREYNLDISLFERMIRNGITCNCLQIQHRMRPEIADNVRHIYDILIDHDSVKHYESVRGVSHNIFFIDHCVEEKKDEELKSFTNEHETKYLIALCKYMLLQGYDASEITILTTYKGQMFMLKREMLKQGELLDGVRMTIVDDYQGEENEIILLSLVRSNCESRVGFLVRDNRVCVALSRAKKGFYVIGNFEVLATSSSLWKSIISGMKQKGLMGKALPLCCENHPNDEGLVVENSVDFQRAPEGGCGKLCDIRLECGHACGKYCHIRNRKHENVICRKPCRKKCSNGHQCKKICWEECVCEEEIIATLPRCGHIVHCICAIDLKAYICKQICNKRLECGHECKRFCIDPCICMIPVKVILPRCGHETTIPCSVKPDQHRCNENIQILQAECGHLETIVCRSASKKTYCKSSCNLLLDCGHLCQELCGKQSSRQLENENRYNLSKCPKGHKTYCNAACEEKLKCGHSCKGKCFSCSRGRWHNPCEEDCNCDLMCGHKCKGKCGYCLPCTEICTRRCFHKYCQNKCIEVCNPCKFPCEWQCEHKRCTKLCGEICNRERCNKPCKRLLSCRHECIGMCGDPCPNQCRICNQDTVRKILFGKENLSSTRFVQLQDCGHLIQYDIMDTYMDNDEGLCLKRCPICREPIRTTIGNRYENTVNRLYCKLNDAKKQILHDYRLNEILNSSVFDQGGVIEQDTREYHNIIQCSRKRPWSGIFTFLDCRGALNTLNLMTVNHFIKCVSSENCYPLINETLLFPHASLCMSSQHWYEIERELKRYVDKCQLEKISNMLVLQEGNDLKVKETLQNANGILSQERVYTEDDREKVQTCINELPETQNFSKRLLLLSITSADINRDDVIRDGGIQISSLYKKKPNARQSNTFKKTRTLNEEQEHLKESSLLTNLTKDTREYDQLPDETQACPGKPSIYRDLSEEIASFKDNKKLANKKKRNSTQEKLFQETDITKNILYELNKEDEQIQDNKTIFWKRNDCTKHNIAGCEISLEKKRTPMIDEGKDLSEEDDHMRLDKESIPMVNTGKDLYAEDVRPSERACDKEFLPTNTDEEPTHFLTFLTWSGYPYFHCKQSKFHLEQIQSSNSDNSNKNGTGSKRKTLDKHNEEPVEKKTKLGYGNNAQRSAPENKKRQHNDAADTETPCKKPKSGVTGSKTDIRFPEERNSDSINEMNEKEINNHSTSAVDSFAKEPNTRNVLLKRTRPPSKSNTTREEKADSNLSKRMSETSSKVRLVQAPATSSLRRQLVDYNDIDMYGEDEVNTETSRTDARCSTGQTPTEIITNVGIPDETQREQSKDLKKTDFRFCIKKNVRCDAESSENAKDIMEKDNTDLIKYESKENGDNSVSDIRENQSEIRDRNINYISEMNLGQDNGTKGFKDEKRYDLRNLISRTKECKSSKTDVKTDTQEIIGANIASDISENQSEIRDSNRIYISERNLEHGNGTKGFKENKKYDLRNLISRKQECKNSKTDVKTDAHEIIGASSVSAIRGNQTGIRDSKRIYISELNLEQGNGTKGYKDEKRYDLRNLLNRKKEGKSSKTDVKTDAQETIDASDVSNIRENPI